MPKRPRGRPWDTISPTLTRQIPPQVLLMPYPMVVDRTPMCGNCWPKRYTPYTECRSKLHSVKRQCYQLTWAVHEGSITLEQCEDIMEKLAASVGRTILQLRLY